MSDDREFEFVGGVLDGQRKSVRYFGPRLLQPVVTQDYVAAHREWFEQYGVAWTWLYWDHIPEEPVIPREPPMPVEEYRLERTDEGEYRYVCDNPIPT